MSVAGQKRKKTPPYHHHHHRSHQPPQPCPQPTPQPQHPYLSGNFAPIEHTLPLTPCSYTGTIPSELADGEYVRNGSNPVTNQDLGRDAHWFDGDGMLSGVSFRKDESTGQIHPEFVNQFVLTDLYLSARSSGRLRVPILPSIATLVNPLASFIYVTLRILRTVLLVLLSHLPGSKQKIKKISVANTNVVYHDGRALATCESGPPMRISLPGLETVGWYNGAWAEGEPRKTKITDEQARDQVREKVLGGDSGLISFMREWTTAHPKIDPNTKEMLMFHSSFAPPYVQYSIIPQTPTSDTVNAGSESRKLLNAAVPGVHGAKMMHDFGVSATHTVIMDLPLTLDPTNQLRGLPPVSYDSSKPSRFGVFPRRRPEETRWFETDASCIFHTANTWDDVDMSGNTTAVNMLACRLTSATLIYASGNIAAPVPKSAESVAKAKRRMPFFSKYNDAEETVYERTALLESPSDTKEVFIVDTDPVSSCDDNASDPFINEQCRLYYYSFSLDPASPPLPNKDNKNTTKNTKSESNIITHQWALSALPFEFPSVRSDREMSSARYVYGCSTTTTSFGSALGKATKIDALVKMDTTTLIARGRADPPKSISGVVDDRDMKTVLASTDPKDPIKVFRLPEGWFAQEPRFVPCSSSSFSPRTTFIGAEGQEQAPHNQQTSHQRNDNDDTEGEDEGCLLFYTFNEAQLLPSGDVPPDSGPLSLRAKSELWILDARDMTSVLARVHLPQRVPYGLHGSWFDAEQIRCQRPVESLRSLEKVLGADVKSTGLWMGVREMVEKFLG